MKRDVEALWQDFFLDTSQWWDHRPEKINPRYPDFKHKQTRESLWLADARNPPWVQAELAVIPPGTLQASSFAWTQRLRRHIKARQYTKTVEVFQQMQQEGICADSRTFVLVLNACAGLGALEEGKRVHKQIIQVGCESDSYVATCLVDMYAKCGSLENAWIVFNKIQEPDVVAWGAMIGGYVKSGQGLKSIKLFQKMQREGVEPDNVTFVGVLNACASVSALDEGRRVHEQIIRKGCNSNVIVATCLVDMYAKCGSIVDAWSVFNNIHKRDVVTWNAMITGYVNAGKGQRAIALFEEMRQAGVVPNAVTLVGVLNACASIAALEEGRRIHVEIIQRGCLPDVFVSTCLVNMYAKCGKIGDAWSVFKEMQELNVVTWSAMIGGYVKAGEGHKALELFRKMQQEGVEPNIITFVSVLEACSTVQDLEEGRRVHQQIILEGCESDVCLANCLVDMYAKCGSIEDAWNIFDKIQERDVVTWSTMIGGYVKFGEGLKAIEVFQKMEREGVKPDAITFVGVLNACASVAALEQGRCIHEQIMQRGFGSDMYVASCLVDMYAKCGTIEDAEQVFHNMPTRDVVSWTAMIGGYAMNGQAKEAIGLFERMGKESKEINETTFTCLLSACSHGGLVEEGLHYFESMGPRFSIRPTAEHYACMVDILGRAGRLGEAEELLKAMPSEADVSMWMSFFGACSIHGNIEMAEWGAERCSELYPGNALGHLKPLNIYAASGKTLGLEVWKETCRTWIEMNNVVHSFAVDNEGHPQIHEIRAELERLLVQMNGAEHSAELD